VESIIVAIALLALVAIAGGLLLKQQRQTGGVALPVSPMARSNEPSNDAPRPIALKDIAPEAEDTVSVTPPVRTFHAADNNDALGDRLDAIERRIDLLTRTVERQHADVEAALRELAARLEARASTDEARGEAARERLRADLLATMTGMPLRPATTAGKRREEVCADLYAHLARLEWALAAVTNPMLLPGEPFAPSADLLPAALIWENWNEVGERAFALGDAFSARRLHLSPSTRQELEQFVTSLRTLLTRAIYPNVQPGATPDQQAAVHAALEEIASMLPRMRVTLEAELGQGEPEWPA
jgi:hypothetical protein